jgi:hypothetical protein
MPRNMSFMLTTEQIRSRTKTVTRRNGWWFLKPGDVLNACVKCMGLNPGEKVERLATIRVVSCRPEPLVRMVRDRHYGLRETTKEGYPAGTAKHEPREFARMFMEHMGGNLETPRNRIEFEHIEAIQETNDGRI